MIRVFALGCLLFVSVFTARAQYSGSSLTYGGGGLGDPNPNAWGIAVSAGYDGPTGDMRSVYGGGGAYSFSVLHNWNGFTFNASFGYTSYKPKQDTIFYYADDEESGYDKYNKYTSLEFYVGGAYNIPIADITNLYLGLNIGEYVDKFSFIGNTGGTTSYYASSQSETQFVAPKLGLNFLITNHLSFGVEGKYNVQFAKNSDGSGSSTLGTYTVSGVLNCFF